MFRELLQVRDGRNYSARQCHSLDARFERAEEILEEKTKGIL